MISKALEGLLPGLREFRVPLVTGLLWVMFGWLLVAESNPTRTWSAAIWQDAKALSVSMGRPATTAIAVTLVYLTGVLATSVTSAAAGAVSAPLARFARWRRWQTQVSANRTALVGSIKNLREHAARAPNDATRDANLRTAENSTVKLKALSRSWRWGLVYVRRTPEATRVVPYGETDLGVADRLVEQAYKRGAGLEMERLGVNLSVSGLGPSGSHSINLMQEVSGDPLDLMAALDASFYQTLDRERAERELRLNCSAPIAAVSVFFAVHYTALAWTVAGAAVFVLLQASAATQDERPRVLSFIALKGLMTGALHEAEGEGREDIRERVRSSVQN